MAYILRKLEGETNKNSIALKSVPVVVMICVICVNFVVGVEVVNDVSVGVVVLNVVSVGVVVANAVSVVVIAEVVEGAFLFVN